MSYFFALRLQSSFASTQLKQSQCRKPNNSNKLSKVDYSSLTKQVDNFDQTWIDIEIKLKINFERNFVAAAVMKWKTKIWRQISWQGLDKLLPWSDNKADVSSVSPSSDTLRTQTDLFQAVVSLHSFPEKELFERGREGYPEKMLLFGWIKLFFWRRQSPGRQKSSLSGLDISIRKAWSFSFIFWNKATWLPTALAIPKILHRPAIEEQWSHYILLLGSGVHSFG